MSAGEPRIALTRGAGGVLEGSELEASVDALSAAAVRADAVDPLITELVRLRCAHVHDCRRCGALRLEEAAAAGLDEEMAAKVADYEASDLGPAAIAALRLCDAIILVPGAADAELRAELAEHFTPAQVAELCLDVVKWSYQKVLVALRLEAPDWESTATLSFDADGAAVVGGPAGR